jgi:hypothetical protein
MIAAYIYNMGLLRSFVYVHIINYRVLHATLLGYSILLFIYSARRHGVFGYPRQSATVSVGFVLK